VALSMEEQRMLDEMERNLAADDPRLASRFNNFGLDRPRGAFRSQRARTISGLLAFVLIAAVTVMMFVLSPYASHQPSTRTPPKTSTTTGAARTGTNSAATAGSS
jgi:hypothetical protein